jgi:bacterioferritin-associated ferredoxin
MYACLCATVRESAVREAIADGAHDLWAVAEATRAGTGCGSCHDRLEELIEEGVGPTVWLPVQAPSGIGSLLPVTSAA